jgi:hypothetical protein
MKFFMGYRPDKIFQEFSPVLESVLVDRVEARDTDEVRFARGFDIVFGLRYWAFGDIELCL